MGVVFVVPPVTEKLYQDSGVGKSDGETDSKTLPQFLGGRDTHSDISLMGIRQKRAISLAKTVTDLNAKEAYIKWASSDKSVETKSKKGLKAASFLIWGQDYRIFRIDMIFKNQGSAC